MIAKLQKFILRTAIHNLSTLPQYLCYMSTWIESSKWGVFGFARCLWCNEKMQHYRFFIKLINFSLVICDWSLHLKMKMLRTLLEEFQILRQEKRHLKTQAKSSFASIWGSTLFTCRLSEIFSLCNPTIIIIIVLISSYTVCIPSYKNNLYKSNVIFLFQERKTMILSH